LFESSLIGRTARSAVAKASAAYRGSRCGHAVAASVGQWQTLPAAGRRWTVGLALLTAAGVHVGLQLVQGAPPSWLWLIVPGIAAAHGLLQLLAARGPRTTR
jgi:hypothetical protein